ncbi:platelet glycoprotein Ib alpha chain-like [Rhineura floridana]|uniref:platelet glycoprotein Ib alpha chain-like n=1 Tax=Rhineura floridana TaxID=261503 RepID=UPI002AC7F734|nr:platelet glycoprotein Ib alpha chain-like [Rhineura floridana]
MCGKKNFEVQRALPSVINQPPPQSTGDTKFSMASFQHLSSLVELDLSNNSLGALETGALLPTLQQLDLSHNALKSLPALQGLPSLRRLALGHNAIAALPEAGFQALGLLQDLELQGNRLQTLTPGAFEGLVGLKDLDLSDNLLKSLPRELLAGLGALEILRLERNQLKNVPDAFFPEDILFAYLYLAENPWACDCGLVYLRDWILENEISMYTRVKGKEKEITENNPESITCQTPAAEERRPVMRFQADCRKLKGDSDAGEEGEGTRESSGYHATTTTPTSDLLTTGLGAGPASTATSPTTVEPQASTERKGRPVVDIQPACRKLGEADGQGSPGTSPTSAPRSSSWTITVTEDCKSEEKCLCWCSGF